MTNEKAFMILEKETLTKWDKQFLKTHLEIYQDQENSLSNEVSRLKDIVDYGQYLNGLITKTKEMVVFHLKNFLEENEEADTKELLDKIEYIYRTCKDQGRSDI